MGLVEFCEEGSKYVVRLIPRVEADPSKKKDLKGRRVPQKIINPNMLPGSERRMEQGRNMYHYKNMQFRRGFLFKRFSVKQLQSDSVIPTLDEVQLFK